MTNKKITDLPVLPAVAGTNLDETAQGDTSYQVAWSARMADINANATINLTKGTGTLSTSHGGTGIAGGYTAGKLLIGNSAGNLVATQLTEGQNIVITNGDGSIEIKADINVANAIGILPNVNTTATSSNTPSTIVERDASGNFSATNITADLIGNADTATAADTVQTAQDTADTLAYLLFVNDIATSAQIPKKSVALTYNAVTGILSAALVGSAVNNNLIAMDADGVPKDSGVAVTTLSMSNDNTHVMTSMATQSAISAAIVSGHSFRGGYDASTNLFPATGGSGLAGAILAGDNWVITVAGTLGGTSVFPNDTILALIDTPAQTSINWAINSAKVQSVFLRVGAVEAQTGDYTVAQVTGAAPLASPTFTGIVTVPAPSNATDAATKGYVDTGLALKAPLASPALTGSPTAPTQSAGDNSTKLGTTAYTDTGLALKADTSTVNAALALKAPLASPTFTGTVTAPALNVTNNTNQIVLGTTNTTTVTQGTLTGSRTFTLPDSNSNSVVPSTAPSHQFATSVSSAGVIGYAQPVVADVTGAAPLASPTFTGTVTAPTLLANSVTAISGNLKLNPSASGQIVQLAQGLAVANVRVGALSASTTFTVGNTTSSFFSASDGFVGTGTNTLDDGAGNFSANTITSFTNVAAGDSGGDPGYFVSYPSGVNKGSLKFVAVNNVSNDIVTVSNASHGQATTYSIPDVGAATGQILNKTSAFVSGNVIAASGTAGVTVDGGIAANKVLTSNITTPDVGSNLIGFNVTVLYSDLASGAHAIIYSSSGSKRYVIRDLKINHLSLNGGDRLVQITDGTTVYSLIPAANLTGTGNFAWGSASLPFPPLVATITFTVAGQSLYLQYSGGTTDYTGGALLVSGILERVV